MCVRVCVKVSGGVTMTTKSNKRSNNIVLYAFL